MALHDYIETSDITKTINTMGGTCFVEFPIGGTGCNFIGLNSVSILIFKEKTKLMFNDDGGSIDFDNITPEEFSRWCHRPDLGVVLRNGVLISDSFLLSRS